jgi:hypothetical protein
MMTEAEALANILAWSADIPNWQRDALRRLATRADLGDAEIDELVSICKGESPAFRWKPGICATRTAIRGKSICGTCMACSTSMPWPPTSV